LKLIVVVDIKFLFHTLLVMCHLVVFFILRDYWHDNGIAILFLSLSDTLWYSARTDFFNCCHITVFVIIVADQCINRDQSKALSCLALPDRHFIVVDSAGQHFVCCVSVIDLDPKRFDKIPFYLAEDQAVSKSYHECTSSR